MPKKKKKEKETSRRQIYVSYSFRNFVRDKVSSISHKLGFWPIFCARGTSKNRTIAQIVRDSWALVLDMVLSAKMVYFAKQT